MVSIGPANSLFPCRPKKDPVMYQSLCFIIRIPSRVYPERVFEVVGRQVTTTKIVHTPSNLL